MSIFIYIILSIQANYGACVPLFSVVVFVCFKHTFGAKMFSICSSRYLHWWINFGHNANHRNWVFFKRIFKILANGIFSLERNFQHKKIQKVGLKCYRLTVFSSTLEQRLWTKVAVVLCGSFCCCCCCSVCIH